MRSMVIFVHVDTREAIFFKVAGSVAGSCRTARRYRSSDKGLFNYRLFIIPGADDTHLLRSIFHVSWAGFS